MRDPTTKGSPNTPSARRRNCHSGCACTGHAGSSRLPAPCIWAERTGSSSAEVRRYSTAITGPSRSARSIEVVYDAKVEQFEFDGDRAVAALIAIGQTVHRVSPKAIVCASGGFEANIDWLREYRGDAADNYIIRGTPHNDGNVLRALFDQHAARAGQERGFHAIAVDARAPKFDGGIATRLDTVPFGVVLNRDGVRFYDEGEDFWPKRYAIWGRYIAQQPGQIAYAFWDAKVNGLFLPRCTAPSRVTTSAISPG